MDRRAFLRGVGLTAVAVPSVSALSLLEGCTQADLTTAITYATEVSTAVSGVLAFVAIASGNGLISDTVYNAAKLVLNEASLAAVTLVAAIKAYEANPTGSFLSGVQSAIASAEAAVAKAASIAGVTDAKTLTAIQSAITAIEGFITMLQSIFPSSTISAAVNMKANRSAIKLSHANFKKQYNDAMVVGGAPKLQLK